MSRKLIVATGLLALLAAVLYAQEGKKREKDAPRAAPAKAAEPATAAPAKAAAPTKEKAAAPAKEKAAAPAKEKDAAPAKAEGTADALDQIAQSYAAAFNKNDAEALAALWAENGVYVDRETGERTEGREAILADFQRLFKDRGGARVAIALTSKRLVRPDVAAIEGNATASLPGDDPSTTAFSALLVKQGDQWLIDSVQESPPATSASAHDALQELEWMVGRWDDESDTTRVETTVRWGTGNTFLVRSFVVQAPDEEEQQGTQVIGWDPRNGQIRSWTFFSDGSFGEGFWSKSGDEWLVKGTQTLPDGRQASGTQVIQRDGDDTVLVHLIGREIDGEPLPSSEIVKVVRSAAPEAAEVGESKTNAPGADDTKEVAK